MRYHENSPKRVSAIIFLVIAFLILYSPWNLGMRELLGGEGIFAALAVDMNILNPSTIAHGQTLSNYFPLYPWIASIAYKLGINLVFALRFISVLSLAALAVIVFFTSKKNTGFHEGIVSTVFLISNVVVFEKAIDGSPFLLGVTFLLSGWLMWYEYGAVRGMWNVAWLISALFCGLAFYTIGWLAFFYFFFPLIFMRRPLTLWKKLNNPGFKFSLCILAFFILLWLIPRLITLIENPPATQQFYSSITDNYLIQVIFFPITFAVEIIPWTIIVWPAFCVAYFPMDKNPIFSRFMRTITISLFFFLWVNPFTETRDFMVLVPPLAVLAGVHYQVLIRRHGFTLHKIIHFTVIIALIVSMFFLILFLVPHSWWNLSGTLTYIHKLFFKEGISFIYTHRTAGIIQLTLSICIGIYLLIFYKKNISIWLHGLCLGMMFMLCFWAVKYPYRSMSHDAEDAAHAIITTLGPAYNRKLTIYKGPEIADIYVFGYYLGCKLKKIYSYSALPEDINTVYVFTLNRPVYQKRLWTMIGVHRYKGRLLYLWKGVLVNKKPMLEI